jgi:hypothetical protein
MIMALETIKQIVKENLRCCYINQLGTGLGISRYHFSYSRDFKRIREANFIANGGDIIQPIIKSLQEWEDIKICAEDLMKYHRQYSQSDQDKYRIVAGALKKILQDMLMLESLIEEIKSAIRIHLNEIPVVIEDDSESSSIYFKC